MFAENLMYVFLSCEATPIVVIESSYELAMQCVLMNFSHHGTPVSFYPYCTFENRDMVIQRLEQAAFNAIESQLKPTVANEQPNMQ